VISTYENIFHFPLLLEKNLLEDLLSRGRNLIGTIQHDDLEGDRDVLIWRAGTKVSNLIP
jgi:hypothetical protein